MLADRSSRGPAAGHRRELDPLADLHELIDRAIRDDAPVTLREKAT
jgi:hypothetical protein